MRAMCGCVRGVYAGVPCECGLIRRWPASVVGVTTDQVGYPDDRMVAPFGGHGLGHHVLPCGLVDCGLQDLMWGLPGVHTEAGWRSAVHSLW